MKKGARLEDHQNLFDQILLKDMEDVDIKMSLYDLLHFQLLQLMKQ